MENNFISAPSDFQHMEGVSVNFKKTFDLNGTDNDEMLRLYLRKAGLSDEIECLTPEQRRAFIYDIIKSNKMPGYWMPSTMRGTMSPPGVRPPLRVSGTSSMNSSPSPQRRNDSVPLGNPNIASIAHYGTMSASSSSSSLQSLGKESVILPPRFVPAPVTPPSPSSFVTSGKGSKYEISGPMNFQHVSGDMTRDMTRNAFDLSLGPHDNVLKKYMIERGITEEDIKGMRKPDVIRLIVQSKFTWMPKNKSSDTISSNPPTASTPNIVYATISRNNQKTPPPSPPTNPPAPMAAKVPTRPPVSEEQEASTANFTLVASRFADPSQFPSPDALFGNDDDNDYDNQCDGESIVAIRLPPQVLRPAPPPRKTKSSFKKSRAPPPPPSAVVATANSHNIYQTAVQTSPAENYYETITVMSTSAKVRAAPVGIPAPPPPPPPPQTAAPTKPAHNTVPAPPPPYLPAPNAASMQSNSHGAPVPPPPPPQTAMGNQMKTEGPVPLSGASGAPPPPPPPPPMAASNGGIPPPPPPSPPKLDQSANKSGTQTNKVVPPAGEDDRDAFLESIRNGITLKKVNQKGATISGAKPQVERKAPPVHDFLSELKMGLTLRRIKNPEDNPFTKEESEESHA